ncbi:MAG TPA: serine/threonine-protein kinase [Polyangiaceae bacterium]|nr:serine/threonine-protein kinase [Polyangiaceae bacterium]
MSVVAHTGNLGKYRLIAELGQGGMADVYLAISTGVAGSQKLVVIKVLRERIAQEQEFVEMFLDEGRLAMRLNHSNVVQTFEVGESEGHHFIVMEYLDGLSLNSLLRATRSRGLKFSTAMHLRVLSDMLSGLDYAHDAEDFDGTPLNIVHRDVTPHNTFVTYDGQVKVVDFGIAKAVRSTIETTTGVIKGKISYMSPEQSRSEPVDRRSDLFAVGIMLWEALTGQRFWKDLSDMTVLQRLMMSQPAPSPRQVNPALSDLAEAVCAKALAPRPADRYGTAAELQADIEALLREMGQGHVTSRAVGRHISAFFAETRAKTKALIEAQMRLGPEGPASSPGGRPTLPLLQTTLSLVPDGGPTPSGGQNAMLATGSGSLAGVRRRPWALATVIGVALAVGAGGAIYRARQRGPAGGERGADRGPVGEAVAAASAAAGGEVPAPRPDAEQVSVRLSATPPEAKLFLDDRPLKTNPYEGKLARDGAPHTLRAEAPGFQPKVLEVSLASDVVLDVELGRAAKPGDARDERRVSSARPVRGGGPRAPSAAPPPPAAPAAASAAPAAPSAAPQGGAIVLPKAPGFRPIVIDSTDPWKREKPQ